MISFTFMFNRLGMVERKGRKKLVFSRRCRDVEFGMFGLFFFKIIVFFIAEVIFS